MIVLLIFIIFVLVLFNFVLFNKDYISPSFILSFAFFVSSIDCALNLEKWNTMISLKTVIVITCGLFSCTICALCARWCYVTLKGTTRYQSNKLIGEQNGNYIVCPKIVSMFFLILQTITTISILKQVILLTAKYGTDGSFGSAISMYQYLVKFTNINMRFPGYLVYLFIFVSSCGYIWGYLCAYNLCFYKKVDKLIIANFIMSCISGMATGSRGNSIQMIISILIIYMFFQRSKKKQKSRELKYLFKIAVIMTVLLLIFESLAGLMGRDTSLKLGDYIAVYLGAPIKNLDIFLNSTSQTNRIWGEETFLQQINWINSNTGKESIRAINVGMTYLNGHNLGNVYTSFRAYYADFGYIGIIILPGLMGFLVQILYEQLKGKLKHILNGKKISVWLIIYAHLLFAAAFTFFSNKFYECFTITFIEKIVFWLLLGYLIEFFNTKKIRIIV